MPVRKQRQALLDGGRVPCVLLGLSPPLAKICKFPEAREHNLLKTGSLEQARLVTQLTASESPGWLPALRCVPAHWGELFQYLLKFVNFMCSFSLYVCCFFGFQVCNQEKYMETPLSHGLLCTDFQSSAVPGCPVFCLFHGVTLVELLDDNILTSNLCDIFREGAWGTD